MKVSLHFQVLAVLYICKFVCGSEESGIAPSMDYPYIMHNMNKLADGWKNVVIRLSFLEDPNINKHLVEYEKLVHTNDSSVQNFLYKMVIQHCISRKLMKNLILKIEEENKKYEEEDDKENPVALLTKAIKLQLEVSESRISNEQFELRMIEENKFKLKKIDEAFSLRKLEGEDDSNALPVMREQMKYVAHTTAMEYIYLSMADSRISTFLIKLFNLMDVNKKTADGFVYYDVILLFDPPSNFRIDTYDEGRDGNNFMRTYFMKVTSVGDYLAKLVRNKQQMFFQNQLIKNHYHMTKEIVNMQHDEVFNEAFKLKLEHSQQLLKHFMTNIFQYKDNTGDGNLSLEGISLVDLARDPTFKNLKESIEGWNDEEFKETENVLSMWTEEKLVMSIIADDDMFLALKQIFQYIDENHVHDMTLDPLAACNRPTPFKDVMPINGRFIPVFYP